MSDKTESSNQPPAERLRSAEMPLIDVESQATTETRANKAAQITSTLQEWASPGRLFTFLSWVIVAVLGLLIFLYFILWSNDARLLALITFGGFGGILYDLSDVDIDNKGSRFEGIIQFPGVKRNAQNQITEMRLGWISHALFGIAGALVIFLVVPIDSTTAQADAANLTLEWDIKTLAFALVGGYGGRALLPTMADGYLKRAAKEVAEEAKAETKKEIEEVKQTAQQATQMAAQAEKIVAEQQTGLHATVTEDELREREELNATTLANIKEHLEPDNNVNPELVTTIKDALTNVSPMVRVNAFELAREYRRQRWQEGINGNPEAFIQMERVIPIFEALIAADTDGRFPRNHGQLGYTLRDKTPPDYARAIEHLDKAIAIRDQAGDVNQYPLYNIMRAVTRVALSQQQLGRADQPVSQVLVEQVLADLRRGREIALVDNNDVALQLSKGIGDSEDIGKLAQWFEVNSIDPETLTLVAAG